MNPSGGVTLTADYSSANVERIVGQFYSQGVHPGINLQKVHEWLTVAQASRNAWSFCWDLISPSKDFQAQFYGASTLAVKVSRYWHELSPDQYDPLRQRLLNLLLEFKGPKIVMTRLCVATAGVVIQCVPHHWPSPITDLTNLFQERFSQNNITPLALLLEILTVVPEDFSTTVLTTARRAEVRHSLASSLQNVIPLVTNVFNQQNFPGEITVQAIKCLQSWVQFGVPMEQLSPLVEKLLSGVHDEELSDSSLDALSSIVSHPDTHKYPNTVKELLKRILNLEPLWNQYMRESFIDGALPLASLFVTFGESHSRMLLDWSIESEEGRQATLKLVSIILSISGCPLQYPTQEQISEMPFGFWYIFQDDIIACDPPQFQQCVAIFRPVYQELVNCFIKKSMYQVDENKWTSDQRESFRCYRTDIADTIMYCFNILRENLLEILLTHLDQSITQCVQDQSKSWPYLEASLHAWSAIAEAMAEEEESPHLSHFLAKLPMIPYNNNMKVISTALDCIGGFAEWLAMHPQLLPHVTPIVTSALPNPDLALCATMALKDIARDCSEGMKPYAQDVIQACMNALNSNQLKPGECIRLMYPIGKMLSLMPTDRILPMLEPIITPHLVDLQNILQGEMNHHTKNKVSFYLKMLTTLFQTLDIRQKNDDRVESQQTPTTPQPLATVLPQLFPMFRVVSEKWAKDCEIAENLSNLLKQCVSTLLIEVKPYVGDIIQLTLSTYTSTPQGASLDLARQIFVLFGNDDDMLPLLQSLLVNLSQRTLQHFQSTGNLSDHTDLIAGFFQMMSQVLKKQTRLMAHENVDVQPLFRCATVCLNMPEMQPVKYSAQFLAQLINVSREHPRLLNLVNAHGEQLFMQVITCIGGENARGYTDYYTEILFAMNKKYFDNLTRWMNLLMQTENFPSPRVTREQKHQFAQLVIRERVNKRKLLEVVREFSLACAGLVHTEYAANTARLDKEPVKNVKYDTCDCDSCEDGFPGTWLCPKWRQEQTLNTLLSNISSSKLLGITPVTSRESSESQPNKRRCISEDVQ